MKKAVLISSLFISSAFSLSAGELETLRSANAEQKRQISSLEKEVNNLYSLLEKEMRDNGKPLKSRIAGSKASASYTVVKGDSLSKIARAHGVALNSLMVRNNLGSNSILKIGQKLSIPSSSAAKHVSEASQLPVLPEIPKAKIEKIAVAKTPAAGRSYKILKGDTFYSVAHKHQVTTSELIQLNPRVSPSALNVGQVITLPKNANVAKKAPVKKPVALAAATKKKITPKLSAPKVSSPIASIPPKQKKIETISITPEPVEMKPIALDAPMTLEDLAGKHGTTVDALNALNGWNFRPSIKLARGSEVYLPN